MSVVPKCFFCRSTEKRETGECAACGCYECSECGKGHYGDASKKCPGGGVTLPKER